jgi:hypothetical protein
MKKGGILSLVLSKLSDKKSLLRVDQYSKIAVVSQENGTTTCEVPDCMIELRLSRFH